MIPEDGFMDHYEDGNASSSSSDDGVRRGLVRVWKLESQAKQKQLNPIK